MMLRAVFATVLAITALQAPVTHAATKLVIAQSSEGFLYAPVYVARAKGFFAEEGIEPEIIVLKGGGSAVITAVISGDVQIAVGQPANVIKAREKGAPLKAFASLIRQFASNVVIKEEIAKKAGLTEKSTIVERGRALKGLRMGITSAGSGSDMIVRALAKDAGLDPDRDLTITPIGQSGMLPAFRAGRIDGLCLSSPTSDIAVLRYGGYMLVNLSSGEYPPLEGYSYMSLIAREDWLEKNPQLAIGVTRAIARAEKLIAEHPDEAKEALRSFFGKNDPDVFEAAFANNILAYPATPRITLAEIELVHRFMMQTEGSGSSVKPEDVFTNAFVEAAEKR